MPLQTAYARPFAEQLAFFRQKIDLPSRRWDDIWQAAHDRAFIVAGASEADLIADFRAAIDRAIAGQSTLEGFRKDFDAIVARHGWTGWTGEGSQAGRDWRTKVIYQTNMATSYAAGRWQQLTDPQLLQRRPYWRYVHADGVMYPRPLHVAWNGLTLRYDDPFWQTHFPPNGWGCHCRITAVTVEDFAAAEKVGKGTPPAGWDNISEKTGAPVGIDKGFAYAPGSSVNRPLQEFINQKLINLDAPVGAAMWEQLAPVLAAEQKQAMVDLVNTAAASMQAQGAAALAHVISPATVVDLASRDVLLQSADVWLRDSELIHALRDAKTGRGTALSLQTWRDLPVLMPLATVYLDTADLALIYVFDTADGLGKLAVRVNFVSKVQTGSGQRSKLTSNFIRTGGLIEERNMGESRYIELEK